jgi:hypothetical protein
VTGSRIVLNAVSVELLRLAGGRFRLAIRLQATCQIVELLRLAGGRFRMHLDDRAMLIGRGQGIPAGSKSIQTVAALGIGLWPLRAQRNPEVHHFKRFPIHLSVPLLPSACLLTRRRPLSARRRQRGDPQNHTSKQSPRQMALRQEQPIIASMFDEPPARLHEDGKHDYTRNRNRPSRRSGRSAENHHQAEAPQWPHSLILGVPVTQSPS